MIMTIFSFASFKSKHSTAKLDLSFFYGMRQPETFINSTKHVR